MTAEIAIVNRSAITLAADSAMTLSVRGARKIYTGTDKIFELSEQDPIGLMIFNNLEFMGVPLDVAIKQFRRSPLCCPFSALTECADAFFAYLTDHWRASLELQRRHAQQLLIPVFRRIRRNFDKGLEGLFSKPRRSKSDDIHKIFVTPIQEEIDKLEALPVAECFADADEAAVADFCQPIVDDLMSHFFPSAPLTVEDKKLFSRAAMLTLHRDTFSAFLSGLVFAGFGRDEEFPSLVAYHIDGIIMGRLKKKLISAEKTGRDTISAKIIPFAQRDIVDRFLVGIDPDLEAGISKYFRSAKEKVEADIFVGARLSARAKERILSNLNNTVGIAVTDFEGEFLSKAKEKYQQQTDDMVLFMAKQELAQLAEALVNITSLKRKFSAEEETVAGPIDVAVISRNDGFVWVKRKHYFPAELNPRYFVRKFGALPQSGDNHATQP